MQHAYWEAGEIEPLGNKIWMLRICGVFKRIVPNGATIATADEVCIIFTQLKGLLVRNLLSTWNKLQLLNTCLLDDTSTP